MSRTFRRNSTDESASCFSEKLSNTESGPLALLASIVQMEKSCISSITSSGRHLQDRCSGVLQRASIPFQLPEVSHSTSIEMPLRTIMSCLSRKQRQFLETYDEKHDLSAPPKYTKGPVNTTERLAALRALITDNKLDGYLIPSSDSHGSEYVAEKDRRQGYISGFTGESSMAIVLQTEACLFVDGRFHESAGREIDHNWTLYKVGVEGVPQWTGFLQTLPQGTRIGLDGTLFGIDEMKNVIALTSASGIELVLLDENLVDKIWQERPQPSKAPLRNHAQYAGQDAGSKLASVRAILDKSKAYAYVVHDLSEIAWLLNLRGSDIPFSPVFEAYLLVAATEATVFLDGDKLGNDVCTYLKDELKVQVRPYDEIWQALKDLNAASKRCMMGNTASYAIYQAIGEDKAVTIASPIDLMKSIKNEVEIRGMKKAYLRDAAAWAQWMAWFERKMGRGYGPGFTEYDAAEQLTAFRARQPLFAGLAYENISASGANAALPHYSADKATAASLDKQAVYLNDSGAQYLDGTIDTTRTYHFGKPKPEQKRAYTRVLQGHISAAEAIFPAGTTGAAIDAFARAPLWRDGLNFMHGTGHGIGSYLNVHEGPQRISSASAEPLRAGQFVSIEPGYYEAGQFGIRIESIYLVKEASPRHQGVTDGGKWLRFERITQIPIDTRLVDWKLMSREEAKWLKEHNRACAKAVLPLLSNKTDRRARKWLEKYV